MTPRFNKATAPNAAMTLLFQIEHHWRGIGEPCRSAWRVTEQQRSATSHAQ